MFVANSQIKNLIWINCRRGGISTPHSKAFIHKNYFMLKKSSYVIYDRPSHQ